MFKQVTPESVGVSSKDLKRYVKVLEKYEISTHAMIMLRHDKIFFEKYYAPFKAEDKHRIYSESKSLVAIATGFAIQDGLMELDKPVSSYFSPEYSENAAPNVKKQTVRNALMMASGAHYIGNIFDGTMTDFVKFYFDTSGRQPIDEKVEGTMFVYDSRGSTVLGAAVEAVTGKSLMEYLNEKLFCKIGVSDESYCIKTPGGWSWGESGMILTPRDMLKIALFTMRLGKWNGEQILSEDYLRDATSNLISTDRMGVHNEANYGYGYLIWRQQQNSFFFNGMGSQFSICVPDKDLVFIYHADTQGNPIAKSVIIDSFYDIVVDNMKEEALPKSDTDYKDMKDYCDSLVLHHCNGETDNPIAEKINKKTYILRDNPMGITKLSLSFEGKVGRLNYTNAQGDKTLTFGMGYNEFGLFPQEGYSHEIIAVEAPGHYYKCAASAEWQVKQKLHIAVQVIDEYFGRLDIFMDFKDENSMTLLMGKTAENFFNEYVGLCIAEAEK